MVLCQLQNINLTFGQKVLFKNAKLFLRASERVGLIGLNGMGKSSLLKIIAGEVSPDSCNPAFIFDKAQHNQENYRFSCLYLPQDLPPFDGLAKDYWVTFYPDLIKMRREDDWEGWEHAGGWKIDNDFTSYCQQFGLTNLEQPFMSMSGGEQRKLALAIGLSSPKSLVLWDEPTNHLDIKTIEAFEKALDKDQRAHLIISHDRYLLNDVCDRILHIQHGQIESFEGNYYAYLRYLAQKELDRKKEQEKLENIHRRETEWVRRGAKARTTKSKSRLDSYDDLSKRLQDLNNQKKKLVSFSLSSSGRETKILFEAQNVSMRFGEQTLFKDLTFIIPNKKKIALIGNNGEGKTTLLKIILGEQQATSGKIKRAEDLSIGLFTQKRDELPMNESALQFVGEGEEFVGGTNGQAKRHIYSYLEDFLFQSDQVHRPLHTFSGGEQNRLRLAKFMKRPCDIWIFDEPTNDLDLETIGILEMEMDKFPGSILFISHDRAFIDDISDQTWLLKDQQLVAFEGGFEQVDRYLEEQLIEEKLRQIKGDTPKPVAGAAIENRPKASNHQKMRWKAIESDVATAEKNLQLFQQQMSDYDYSAPTSTPEKLLELEKKVTQAQRRVDELIEEWSELEKYFG